MKKKPKWWVYDVEFFFSPSALKTLTKQNRIKVLSPKKGKFWCGSCDRALTSDGAKCPYCGKRNGEKRFKK